MLHLEYRDKAYGGSKIEIVPDNPKRIPELRRALERQFMIENPAKVFARKLKAGEYDSMTKYQVEEEARIANFLSDAWVLQPDKSAEATLNVMQVLSRLMQLYVNSRKELENIYDALQ